MASPVVWDERHGSPAEIEAYHAGQAMPSDEWDEYTQQPIKNEAEKLAEFLDVYDQTVGCDLCGRAWWGDNYTPRLIDFHADECPLKGRADVHAIWGGAGEAVLLEPVYTTNPAAAG